MKKFLVILILNLFLVTFPIKAYSKCTNDLDFEFKIKNKIDYGFIFKNKSAKLINIIEIYIKTKDGKTIWGFKPRERKDLSYPKNQYVVYVRPYRIKEEWIRIPDLNPDLNIHSGTYVCEYEPEPKLKKPKYKIKIPIEKKPWWKIW